MVSVVCDRCGQAVAMRDAWWVAIGPWGDPGENNHYALCGDCARAIEYNATRGRTG